MIDVTVCIPTIPPRADMLQRAVASVERQTLPASSVIVQLDSERMGAPATRQRALERVTTEWVAFLDDDDEMLPNHLSVLERYAAVHAADYVYSWYWVRGGNDPLPHFGKAFDPCVPTQTTITTLVRTELAQDVGFLRSAGADTPDGGTAGEDWAFTLGCVERDAHIIHAPVRTWVWNHWGGNTSGLATRW